MFKLLQCNSTHEERWFIAGDLSGNFGALQCFLREAQFDPDRDKIILNGNFLGLSPRSRDAMAWLDKPWVIALLGRNEYQVISYLTGEPVPSLYTQWLRMIAKPERDRLLAKLSDLPSALEVNHSDCLLSVTCPSPLPQGLSWQAIKEKWIGSDIQTVCQRHIANRFDGLRAMGVIGEDRGTNTPDIAVSVSSFVCEAPRRPLARSGNRIFMLSSPMPEYGEHYIHNSVIALAELNSLVTQNLEQTPWTRHLSTRRKSLAKMS